MEPFRDERGTAFEPVGSEALPEFRNVHVVTTGPGHVRGNHVHHRTTEVLVVRGAARVAWREGDASDDRIVDVPDGAFYRFRFPPGVPHAVRNTGTGEGLLVAFRDTPYDSGDPDVTHVPVMDG